MKACNMLSSCRSSSRRTAGVLAYALVVVCACMGVVHAGIRVPDAVSDVTASSSFGGGEVQFVMRDSAFATSSFGPLRYRVFAHAVSTGAVAAEVLSPAPPAYVIGLSNGESYYFAVRAENVYGEYASGATPTSNAVVAGAPARVSRVDTRPANHSVTLMWTIPAANAAPITEFVVVAMLGASGSAVSTNVLPVDDATGSLNTSFTVPFLDNDVGYTFSVVARNSVGDSVPHVTNFSTYPQGSVCMCVCVCVVCVRCAQHRCRRPAYASAGTDGRRSAQCPHRWRQSHRHPVP